MNVGVRRKEDKNACTSQKYDAEMCMRHRPRREQRTDAQNNVKCFECVRSFSCVRVCWTEGEGGWGRGEGADKI